MAGTTTNVITAAVVEGPDTGDCPQFKPLMGRTIADGFRANEVCGDNACLSEENLELAAKHGAATYTPFESNSVPGGPGKLRGKLFGFFQFSRADFLARYHQRSNVESTFSMVRAKFRDSVRSKTDTAMKNEVLLKFLCHNLVVVHQAIMELGIAATFWPINTNGSAAAIKFPGVG